MKTSFEGKEAFIQNDKFGWRFFGPTLARTPRPMVLAVHKPSDTFRVVIFGESAAYGDPKPEFGLPRVLQVLLEQAMPDRKIEVVNAAMTGINSHAILPIARDCTALQADAWVLYMGNNEVVGPFGCGSIFGPSTPPMWLIRTALALKSTRVGQLASDLFSRLRKSDQHGGEWRMQLFTGSKVGAGDLRLRSVYAHFSRNLSDILLLAQRRGTRVVVATVASNLKDCAPFASVHAPNLPADRLQDWERLYEVARKARAAADFPRALADFQAAAVIDPSYAQLHYEWGKCALAAGKREEALDQFFLARDLDALRFRADSRLNAIVREIAQDRGGSGLVLLADCERAIARASADGIAGSESLYEHVHFNFEGNYRAALCIAEVLKGVPRQAGNSPLPAAPPRWLSMEECANRLAWTRMEECKALKSVMLRLSDPPFTGQAGHEETRRVLRQRIEQLLPSLDDEGLQAAALSCSNALVRSPEDWVLQRNYGDLLLKLNRRADAQKCYAEVVRLLPHDAIAKMQLGLVQLQSGETQQGVETLHAALKLQPDSVPVLNALAVAAISQHRPAEAIAWYERTLALKPLSSETHLNFMGCLSSQGRQDEALQHLRAALLHPPDTPDFRVRLGRTAAGKGWFDAAITNFTRATELDPVDAKAHFYLGSALMQTGRMADAAPQLREAVRLDPNSATARAGLGALFVTTGRFTEALEHLGKALALQPNMVEARLNLAFALQRLGQEDEAKANLEVVLKLDPANSTAKQLLTHRR